MGTRAARKIVAARAYVSLLVITFAPGMTAATIIDEITADAPIAWWRMEDASSANGATATDSAGSFDGTYSGDVQHVAGIAGQSSRFDGDLDSISIGSMGALPTEGTIEMLLWAEAVESFRNPFTTGPLGGGSTGNRAIRFEADNSQRLRVHIGDDTTGSFPPFSGTLSSSVSTNAWHHLVLTWDTGAGTVDGYFDNVHVINGASNSSFPSNLSDVRIGLGFDNLAQRSWLGRIDEVAIYDKQLSESRVDAHFTAIPEPLTLPLTGIAIAGLAGYRWHTRRERCVRWGIPSAS